MCGDKGINFLDYFFDKGGVLLLSLQRHSIPQRLSGKKWVWQKVELFFFFPFWWSLQGFTTEIQIKSAESFLWDGQTENCEWGCSALCYFPGAFLSSGHHIVSLKAHPIKVRDCAYTHARIPLHWGGTLRNLLQFARIAQTQINVCNCCSTALGFLTS